MNKRLLSNIDLQQLYTTFNAAFASYFVKFQPTEEEFHYRLKNKIRMDYSVSAGAYDGDQLVGFIIHTSNIYQGIPTAYNGGTGVLPGFRNQKVAEEIYEYLIPKIQTKFLGRILLEVIESNDSAIKLYEKIGFTFSRKMRCFKQTHKLDFLKNETPTELGNINELDFSFNDFEPSFIDSEAHLLEGNEKVLVCKIEGELAGFAVFQPHLGRISQLSVARKYRGLSIGKSLLYNIQKHTDKKLTIMNIPEDQESFHLFLKRCGFENQINQFEMELII